MMSYNPPISPKTKSGVVIAGAFSGNPKKANVVFTTAFTDANYSVALLGNSSRTWSIEGETATGFTINSNANTAPTSSIYWMTTKNGEN
jgi:hypothetical protein